jgi:hypothetical protein
MIDRFLIWWSRSGRCTWSRFRRRWCERKYLNHSLPTAESLEEIESHLRQVTWTMDGLLHLFDCISYPQVTWTKKKDDCDGFASLAAALLNQIIRDYKPVLLTAMMRPLQSSHTICAFSSPQDRVWFFDNYYLRRGEWQTYAEVVAQISKPPLRLVCWDIRDPITLELIEFHEM